MANRLGQNPFDDDFRNKHEKYLDLFIQNDKGLTKPSSESHQTQNETKQSPNKQRTFPNSEEKLVYDYLIKNGISKTLDISMALNLDVFDAIRILQRLESKGMVLKAKES